MGHVFIPYIPPAAAAAGAVTEATAYQNVIDDTTLTNTWSVTSGLTCAGGANNCLVLEMAALQAGSSDDPDFAQSTVTFGGQTMTLAGSAQAAGTGVAAIYYLMNPPTTASATLAITLLRSDGSTEAFMEAMAAGLKELSGVAASGTIGNTDSTFIDNTAGDSAMTLTPNNDNSWMMYAYSMFQGGTLTSSADVTDLETGETGPDGLDDVRWLFGEHDVGTAASLTFDVTVADVAEKRLAAVVVEFVPA